MTRVAILTRTLNGVVGGVEKMVLSLAKGLTDEGHKVTVISLDSLDSKAYFEWPIGVDWVKLNIGNADFKASYGVRIKRVRAIRNIFKMSGTEVVIGFQIGSFALARFSAIGLSIHSVAAERNSPTLFKFIHFGRFKRFVSQLILCSASKITVQFDNYRRLYPKMLQKRIMVTPNPVAKISSSIIRMRETAIGLENTRLLYVGRFSYQKNVECLIKAFELLPEKYSLTLLGPESVKFESRIISAGFNSRISFQNEMENLEKAYFTHDIFCLPSRFEGFPNVVGEALAHGMPVVGFEKCSGLLELIIPGVNGEIAVGNEDHRALSEAIIRASENKYDSRTISETISEYTFEKFVKSWITAIKYK
jgi:glycosyltransferase involved in cell wall biosynthesis